MCFTAKRMPVPRLVLKELKCSGSLSCKVTCAPSARSCTNMCSRRVRDPVTAIAVSEAQPGDRPMAAEENGAVGQLKTIAVEVSAP